MKLTWWGWYFINYARHIHYKGTRSADGLQSARPPVLPPIFRLRFFDFSKGCAVTPSRVSSSKVKVKADIYENPCSEHIFSFFFFGLIWVIFHPLAFGQWVKVTFSDVRRSYRTHTQQFLFSKHISYSHSPSWLILYTELLGKGCEFTLNVVSKANVNVIKADLFITHF